MKKKTKYMDFYTDCMIAGERLPYGRFGICYSFERFIGRDESDIINELFLPLDEEYDKIKHSWWASGSNTNPLYGEFTTLRQTIVLFLAAMHDEL